uniref:CCHC-type domain-containing protein n=1 Tax=Clytia hemisphaerica TaxID=252671 RepID=A0A7M5VCD2_9CNID
SEKKKQKQMNNNLKKMTKENKNTQTKSFICFTCRQTGHKKAECHLKPNNTWSAVSEPTPKAQNNGNIRSKAPDFAFKVENELEIDIGNRCYDGYLRDDLSLVDLLKNGHDEFSQNNVVRIDDSGEIPMSDRGYDGLIFDDPSLDKDLLTYNNNFYGHEKYYKRNAIGIINSGEIPVSSERSYDGSIQDDLSLVKGLVTNNNNNNNDFQRSYDGLIQDDPSLANEILSSNNKYEPIQNIFDDHGGIKVEEDSREELQGEVNVKKEQNLGQTLMQSWY